MVSICLPLASYLGQVMSIFQSHFTYFSNTRIGLYNPRATVSWNYYFKSVRYIYNKLKEHSFLKKKKGYNNKDSWLEKVWKQIPGIKREFENLPNPQTKSSFNYTRVIQGQWRGKNMKVLLIIKRFSFLLKKIVFLYLFWF